MKTETRTPEQTEMERLARLLLRLGSADTAERWRAQTELRQSAPARADLLIPMLVRLARIRRQSPFLIFAGLFAAGLLTLGLLLVFDGIFGRSSHLPVLLACVVGFGFMIRRWLRLRTAARRALLHFNDVRLIGPLLDIMDSEDHEAQQVTLEILESLLPRLHSGQADLIGLAQPERLLALTERGDEPLSLAALKALAQLDNGEALPPLRLLTADESRSAAVREAAQNSVNEIAARQAKRRISSNLLRIIDKQ